ncbi:p064 [Rhizobium phage 16-3]|nr:p064 [Rhizobium phage 16-3]ABF71318.1 p064 [Rhizobium phage 16-3]
MSECLAGAGIENVMPLYLTADATIRFIASPLLEGRRGLLGVDRM